LRRHAGDSSQLLIDVCTDLHSAGRPDWVVLGTVREGDELGWFYAAPEQQPTEGAAEFVHRMITRGYKEANPRPNSHISIQRDSHIDRDSDLFQTIDNLLFSVVDGQAVAINPSAICAACGNTITEPALVRTGFGSCCRKRLRIHAKKLTKSLSRECAS
jgi:hypothetical protein